jgi:non-homologous end joining protein Ku
MVLFTIAEFEAFALAADGIFELVSFEPATQMDPLLLDGTAYYVGIDSEAPPEAYPYLLAAIAAGRLIGLVRMVLDGRERFAALAADTANQVLTLSMLYYSGEVRDVTEVPRPETVALQRKQLTLMKRLVAEMTIPRIESSVIADCQPDRLKEFMLQRKAGRVIASATPAASAPAAVLDLTARLHASLGDGRPAGVKTQREGRVARRPASKRRRAARV